MLLVSLSSLPLAVWVSLPAGLTSLCADLCTLSGVPIRGCWCGEDLGVVTAVGELVAYAATIWLVRCIAFAEDVGNKRETVAKGVFL